MANTNDLSVIQKEMVQCRNGLGEFSRYSQEEKEAHLAVLKRKADRIIAANGGNYGDLTRNQRKDLEGDKVVQAQNDREALRQNADKVGDNFWKDAVGGGSSGENSPSGSPDGITAPDFFANNGSGGTDGSSLPGYSPYNDGLPGTEGGIESDSDGEEADAETTPDSTDDTSPDNDDQASQTDKVDTETPTEETPEEPAIGQDGEARPTAEPSRASTGGGGGGGVPDIEKKLAETASAGKKAETVAALAEEGAIAGELLPWIVIVFVIILVLLAIFTAISHGNPEGATVANAQEFTPSVICLDPGHPSDIAAGTSSPDGTEEKYMNQLVADDLAKTLTKDGYKVIKTKEMTDNNTKLGNKARVDKCVAGGADFMLRIHMDEPGAKRHGPWIEVPGPSLSNVHDKSLALAKIIQNNLASSLGVTSKTSGAEPINGGVTNDTKALEGSLEANAKNLPVALVEMMTMSNANVAWLKDATNRAAFVSGLAKGTLAAVPVDKGGAGGNTKAIVDKACEYVKNTSLYQSQMVKTFTDCWGFVATVVKNTVDPKVQYSMRAADAPSGYFNQHKDKYTEISVTSTSQLQPGDLLFRTSGGSHASLWVGKGGCGCSGGVVAASLGSHGPQCSIWYPAMSVAERYKGN